MFKSMTLGQRIGSGFVALVIIVMVLGGLAIWSMRSAGEQSAILAVEYIPEVSVANEMERSSLQTMLESRSYALSEQESYLIKTRENLSVVKKNMQNARELAGHSPHLTGLNDVITRAEAKIAEYEQMIDQTKEANLVLGKIRETLNNNATRYMKICLDFLASQEEFFKKEIAENADGVKIQERYAKIKMVHDIMNLGNAVRISCFKTQVQQDAQFVQDALKGLDDMGRLLDELKKITIQEVNLKQIDGIRVEVASYKEAVNDLLENMASSVELTKKRTMAANAVLEQAQTTAAAGIKETSAVADRAVASLSTASTVMMIGLGTATVLGVLLAVFITRGITGPIGRIISGLSEGADQVNDAANQVALASQQLADGASQQASSLEETSSALEEMASMTRTNAGNAKEANELAGKARTAAADGDKRMVNLNAAMDAINESSSQISKIIKVIEEIAFQTNLLALNAAVEAARAGEHGKGFAVVADEVRNLAQRAAQAARETTSLIENAVNNSREGTNVAGQVGQSLSGIIGDVTKVSELVGEITKASEEQAQGVEQVNVAVSQMDKVTQQNAAGAEESASAAEEMAAQVQTVKGMVQELVELVGGSRTRGGTVSTAVKVTSSSKKAGHGVHATAIVAAKSASPSQPQGDASGFLSMHEEGDKQF